MDNQYRSTSLTTTRLAVRDDGPISRSEKCVSSAEVPKMLFIICFRGLNTSGSLIIIFISLRLRELTLNRFKRFPRKKYLEVDGKEPMTSRSRGNHAYHSTTTKASRYSHFVSARAETFLNWDTADVLKLQELH